MSNFAPVIVTSAQSRVGYVVARQLARAGVPVVVGSSSKLAMARRSRYVRDFFVYPSPFSEPDRFIDTILTKAEEYSTEVFMPVLEESFLVAKRMDSFNGKLKTALPAYDSILSVHDKFSLGKVALRYGVPTPDFFSFEALAKGEVDLSAINFPVMVKPRQGGGGWAVRECVDSSELMAIFEAGEHIGLPLGRFFVQEKIRGDAIGVAALFRDGECLSSMAYRQLRSYPVGYGQPTYRAGASNAEAEGQLVRLLEHLGWTGVCQADFLIQESTGIPYLLDVNPRYWGSVGHSIAAGVDIPLMHYNIACGRPQGPAAKPDTMARSRWLGGDLMGFWAYLKQSERRLGFVKDFVFSGSSYCDDFTLRDPIPFFGWMYEKAYMSLRPSQCSADAMEGIWE